MTSLPHSTNVYILQTLSTCNLVSITSRQETVAIKNNFWLTSAAWAPNCRSHTVEGKVEQFTLPYLELTASASVNFNSTSKTPTRQIHLPETRGKMTVKRTSCA